MPEKGATRDLNALSDALWSVFTPFAPEHRTGNAVAGDDEATFSPDESDARRWLTKSRRVLIGILFLLIAITITVTIFDFSSFKTLFSTSGRATASWRDYQIAAVLLMLLTMEVVVTFVVVVRDRVRKRMEELLRASEERMEFAAESANLGLWEWDARNDRFWSTEHCREMFGILPGTNYTMAMMTAAIHPDDLSKVSQALRKGIETNALFIAEYRLSLGDGETRWVRVRGRPTRDLEGRLLRIAGIIANITDRVRLQNELERQQQSLTHLTRVGVIGELSSALAHELNQPLTAILSNAQAVQRMLGMETIDIDELRGAIADIIEDDSRAGDVIRHLRTLLKKDEVRFERLGINQLILRALSLVRNELTVRHVIVSTGLSPQEPLIYGDAVQLQQLFLNLVLNAADAMNSGGRTEGVLSVTSELWDEGMIAVSISDTGTGIAPDAMENLFEPFFSTKKHGLGLGLSICRAIVGEHGGTIKAENNIGLGSTFRVLIPLAKMEAS